MKLIQQSQLFFKEGTSDKVYEVDLCEVGTNLYVVNFRYGKRGGTLKEGTKTPTAVSRTQADQIFSDLEAEKRKKGYQTETEMFQELPVISTTKPNTKEGVLLQRLQDAIDGKNSFKTTWKTSRVIWQAGVLKQKEAVPYFIKLIEKGDELQRYTCLWALVNCKTEQAIPTFKAYHNNGKYKDFIQNIANEGLNQVLEGEALVQHHAFLVSKLPTELQEQLKNRNQDTMFLHLNERLIEQKKADFLPIVYLLVPAYPELQTLLVGFLKQLPFTPPYFKGIRAIYKLAQVRQDASVLGVLSYKLELTAPMFTKASYYDDDEDSDSWYSKQYIQAVGQRINIKKELKKKESRIAFSNVTKAYLQRNSIRYLTELGKRYDAKTYLKLAVSILIQYQEQDYKPSKKELKVMILFLSQCSIVMQIVSPL